MGYTTDFSGAFQFDRPLTQQQADYINKFSETRRMARNVDKIRELFGNNSGKLGSDDLGIEGEFFVNGGGSYGQDRDASVIEFNNPPKTQPELWCQWIVTADLSELEWDGGEEFYKYIDWLLYLIHNFFKPWGYKLSGEVIWYGEDNADTGKIIVKDNVVQVKEGKITY